MNALWLKLCLARKPAKPKITLTLSKDKASATLTIKKTKRAEGYQIMVKVPGAKKYTELADSDCTDKVFLLSLDEVTNKDYGFEREADRTCAPSKAAKGVYVYKGYADYGKTHVANEDKFACYYWLRTRKDTKYTYDYGFYLVEDDGQIGSNVCWGDEYPTGTGYDMEDELYIEEDEFGIRPALVVELKSGIENVLSKTGKTMKEEWKNAQ